MTSDAAGVIQNTRERLTSTSLNRTQDLQHRLTLEMIAQTLAALDTGVINGLTLSMPNTSTVDIAAGFAQIFDSTVVYPDSQKRLVELRSALSVGLSPASGVNNRWDGIFISPRSTNLPDVAVDIFDPSTGTFSSQPKPKETENDPLITIVEGAVAASPALPLNPGGSPPKIPLGFIYRPVGGAGATTTMLFGARPIMAHVVGDASANITIRDAQFIRGGGVRVDSGFTVKPQNCVGSFVDSGIIFTIGTGCTVDFADDEYRDQDTLAALPSADTTIYWYAHPVPIAIQGAQSELEPGVDSIALLPGISASQQNCMILASTTIPDKNIAQGRPSANLRSITTVYGDVVIDRDSCIYLGSTDYNFSALEMNRQNVNSAGHVIREDGNVPRTRWDNLATPVQMDLWTGDGISSSQGLFPRTATRVHCINDIGAGSSLNMERRAVTDESGAAPDLYYENGSGLGMGIKFQLIYYPDSSGEITMEPGQTVGSSNNCDLLSMGYDDAVLGRR